MRLLLVEDDARIAQPTARALRDAGHAVTLAGGVQAGLREAQSGEFDALLLDVMLPDGSGFELTRAFRRGGGQTPIIFLSARGSLSDRVEGLDLGGDAYLPKPFELPELLATLRAVVRRTAGAAEARREFGAGLGLLDTRDRTASWRGQPVGLTAREYNLLEALVVARGRWFTRDELLSKVWGPDFSGDARVVDVYVSYLRRKLEHAALESSRGLGYRAPD